MKTKIISIILTVALLFTLTQTVAFATDVEEITVRFSATSDEIIVPLETLTVTDGTAEEYGYTVSAKDHNDKDVVGVTALDVLVAAHADYYGDAFTAETAQNYLVLSGGYLQKAFGKSTFATGFSVDGKTPHDDIMLAYGYTGYTWDTTELDGGESVQLYFYQDTSLYSDYIADLGCEYDLVSPGDSITYTLTGYSVMYYGYASDETIAENTEVLADVDVYMKEADDETFTKVGTTDENGQITVTFDEAGEYILYATGETDTGSPIIYTWSTASVIEEAPVMSFFEWIISHVRTALDMVFDVVGGFVLSVYVFIKNLLNR